MFIEFRYWNDYKFRSTIEWAYKFSEMADLYDDAARKLLNLAGQELNIIARFVLKNFFFALSNL